MEGEGPRRAHFQFEKLEENYRAWSAYCKAYLTSKELWEVVETPRPGLTPMPQVAAPPEGVEPAATSAAHAAEREIRELREKELKALQAWTKKDAVALAEIQMAVKPHLLDLVVGCRSAAEAWECLRVLFEDNTTSRRDDLEEELATLRMKAGESIMKYVGRAKGLRNDLAITGVAVEEHSLVLRILRGLPGGYSTIRTVLKSKDGPLKLSASTALLMGVEKELAPNGDGEVPPAVQAYLERLKIKGDNKAGRGGSRDDKKFACFYCKRPGQKIADFLQRKASDKRRGGEGKGGQDGRGADSPKGDEKKIAFCTRVATSSKNKDNTAKKADFWMVDSGATHHMATGNGNFLEADSQETSEITLTSGDSIPATGMGEAKLVAESPTDPTMITLKDAYHVPGLDNNLMSVGIVDKSDGGVLFTKGH